MSSNDPSSSPADYRQRQKEQPWRSLTGGKILFILFALEWSREAYSYGIPSLFDKNHGPNGSVDHFRR